MKSNITTIKNDEEFLLKLISLIEKVESSEYPKFSIHLSEIKEIALGNSASEFSKESYCFGIQRILDDTGEFSRSELGNQIAEVAYYFAYLFKIKGSR